MVLATVVKRLYHKDGNKQPLDVGSRENHERIGNGEVDKEKGGNEDEGNVKGQMRQKTGLRKQPLWFTIFAWSLIFLGLTGIVMVSFSTFKQPRKNI